MRTDDFVDPGAAPETAAGEAAKSELWWVSVGGEACEPAQVVTSTDDRTKRVHVFTIGCNDGTLIGIEGAMTTAEMHQDYAARKSGIVLVKPMGAVPPTLAEQKENRVAWEKARTADAAKGIHHSYRRFK